MKVAAVVISAALSALPGAHAWGALGHNTVGFVASDFVSSATKTYCQGVLGTSTTDYLAAVATWADSYRYTADGKWSAPLHYIDALDNPPETCGVDFDRDCGESGCIVSAIANYTSRLDSKSSSNATQAEALKFLVHFLGDIHQPLHNENLEIGGNTIKVTFDGVDTNLHSVWDTSIIQKAHGSPTLANAAKLADELAGRIKNGTYGMMTKGWVDGMDVEDAQGSATGWAGDANEFVCSTVLKEGVDQVESEDLGGKYYEMALPVTEQLLATAGYRLAAWLDLIVTGSTTL